MPSQQSTATGYHLEIAGKEFVQANADGVEQIVLEDHIDMVNLLTVRFGGTEHSPEWNFNIGDEVKCSLGKGKKPIFTGEIIATEPSYQIDGTSTITLRCLDKMHRLGRGRKTRFWEKMKDSDVASEVGGESKLSVDADATPDTHAYILQRNESNIAFIKRLAARNNFLVSVVDDKLEFKKASFGGQTVTVEMGESLRSFKVGYNTTDLVQKVVVRGWDIKKKEEIVGTASIGDVTPVGGGQVGAQVASKFGESVAYITDVPVSSQAQATEIAKAEMERLARQFCRGTATVRGNDEIRAGGVVEFKGLAKNLNGKFYVMSTRHIISAATGYTTEITFCSNTQGT